MQQCNATTVKEFEVQTVTPTTWPSTDHKNINKFLTGLVILSACIFAFIICGNLLTIIAVRTYRRLRAVVSNLFILSLAISDLLVGCSLPFHMTFYISKDLLYIKELCLIRFFLVIFSCTVSIMTLITIALDRYIAILYCMHYRRCMRRRIVYYYIGFIWTFGLFVALIPMFFNNWKDKSRCYINEVLPLWYISFMIAPGFLIIWFMMLFIYTRISRVVAKQVRQCFHKSSEWKSLQVVIFVMGCFSLCWLPYLIITLFSMYKFIESDLVYLLAFMLAISNSGLNPLIYAWKNSHFREAFRELFCCKNTAQTELEHTSAHSHICAQAAERQGSIFAISMQAFAILVENNYAENELHAQEKGHTKAANIEQEHKIECSNFETFLRKSKNTIKNKFRNC